jgi:hypothetical protein
MNWSTDHKTHLEMVANIADVYKEADGERRWRKALGYVAASSAWYSEPDERVGTYCSVLAQAALYPESMREASEGVVNKE